MELVLNLHYNFSELHLGDFIFTAIFFKGLYLYEVNLHLTSSIF